VLEFVLVNLFMWWKTTVAGGRGQKIDCYYQHSQWNAKFLQLMQKRSYPPKS